MSIVPVAYDEAAALSDPAVQLLPAFRAAAADTMPSLKLSYPNWRAIRGIMSEDEAVDLRAAAREAGVKVRVDFKRVLQRHVQARFPGFEPSRLSNDGYRYQRPINGDLAVALEWRHISGNGIGKVMEVWIGAQWGEKVPFHFWSPAWLWGVAETAAWTYFTKEDLEDRFDAAADFLDSFLPPFTTALGRRMASGSFPGAGPCTAREAHAVAAELAKGLPFIEAELRPAPSRWGPAGGPDGRVRAHGEWLINFRNAGDLLQIGVPFLGPPRALQFKGLLSRREFVPEPWIDSSEAMQAVSGHTRFPTGAALLAMTLGHPRPFMPKACWRMDFISMPYARILVWVDAESGEPMFHQA